MVELNNLQGKVELTLNNSHLVVSKDTIKKSYLVDFIPPYYSFKNPADALELLQTFGLDSNEINSQLSNAYPDSKNAAERLLNKVVSSNNHIILSGFNSADTIDEEAGGTFNAPETITEDATTDNKWLYLLGGLLLAGITGGVGYALGKNKKTVVKSVEAIDKKNELDAKSNEPIEAKYAKAQNDLAQLKTKNKSLADENKKLKNEITTSNNFRKTYFTNAMNELIVPFNNAIEKNDAAQSMAYLLKMGAHFSSWTKNELLQKEGYDMSNINALLHQPDNTKIPSLSINSAPDKTPNKIKFVQELMKNNKVSTLDNTIIFGYKIVN